MQKELKRFTKNNDTQYDFVGRYDTNIEEFSNNKELRISVMNKLGQLEDIEEELGIDLVTLFKALKNGILFVFQKKGLRYISENDIMLTSINGVYYLKLVDGEYANLEDYGITWAFTKEELE